jgi:hypothetical protein
MKMRRAKRLANALAVALVSILLVSLFACGGGESTPAAAEGEVAPADAAADAPPPPPTRRRLDGDPAAAGTATLDSLQKIDLKTALSAGQLTVESNDPRFQVSTDLAVDGKNDTLLVGGGMNPVELTLTLDRPVKLRAARATFAGSPHDWVIEPVPGQRHLVANAPEHDWSQIDFDPAVDSGVVRFEFLRLERDDYVHVGEIELYAEPTP